jgi:hypothetical protein
MSSVPNNSVGSNDDGDKLSTSERACVGSGDGRAVGAAAADTLVQYSHDDPPLLPQVDKFNEL